MQRPASRLYAFVLSALLSAGVVAVPAATAAPVEDDMGSFMAEKGLVDQTLVQIQQATQAVTNRASELVVNAMGFLGMPYRRGGNSADTGFDCSGFVRAMYQQTVGLLLPRSADQQAAATQKIDKTELQPGDLVFFNTLRRTFSHVGIYVGEGKFIHSPHSGSQVRVEDMGTSYWRTRFDGARRVVDTATTPATGVTVMAAPGRAAEPQLP